MRFPEDGCKNKVPENILEEKFSLDTPSPHPLLIDHIVENVLNYLPNDISQLFNLRFLCSQWNHYATKAIQRKHYLSFGGHKYNVGRLKLFLEEFDFNQENQNEAIYENPPISFPVTRFRLFSDLFQEFNKATVVRFMQKCGSFAESLVIFKDINSDIEYTPEELSTFNFPRLRHLVFSDRRRSGFSMDANMQSFLLQLVSSSRNTLTTLNIKFPREPIYEIYEKEDLMIKVFRHCEMPRLRELKLDMSVTNKMLDALTEVNLRLRSLQLSLGASQFSPESLKALLNTMQYTLEDLKLTDLYRRAALVIDLPHLPKLEQFEIHGLELPAYFVNFPDFNYSKMPKLKRLKLNTWAPIKAWEVFVPEDDGKGTESTALAGITDLSLAMNFDCPMLMRRVTNSFKSVCVLDMHFSRSSVAALQVVFQTMSQLEVLKLHQSYLGEISSNCIDDVLTGLDPEECKWILRKKSYKEGVDLSTMDRKPNLTDLKNLKRFDMLSLRHRNMITDVSAYLAFLKMDSLVTLDIGRSQLSDGCLRDLANKFPFGKFEKYLMKKRAKAYDSSLYRNSVFTSMSSICAVQ